MDSWWKSTTIRSSPFPMAHKLSRPRNMRSLSEKFVRSARLQPCLIRMAKQQPEMPNDSRPMLLLIDNYDSFTYNLAQYFGELGCELVVRRNDAISLKEIGALAPERICISPGPCTPREAGISKDVILAFGARTPILGVCLGHQCIAEAYGGEIVRASRLMHGKASTITHNGNSLFSDLATSFEAGRYHSLVV